MEKMDGVIPLALQGAISQSISQLGSGFEVKGVVASQSELPASGNVGEIYLVADEGYETYTWSGSEWVIKAGDVATNADIDAALYS